MSSPVVDRWIGLVRDGAQPEYGFGRGPTQENAEP